MSEAAKIIKDACERARLEEIRHWKRYSGAAIVDIGYLSDLDVKGYGCVDLIVRFGPSDFANVRYKNTRTGLVRVGILNRGNV